MFKALTLNELIKIVDIQTESLKKRLADQDIELEITEEAKHFLANEGYEPLYGARPLRRVIRQLVEIPMSMSILDGQFVKGDKIKIDCKDNSLVFDKK